MFYNFLNGHTANLLGELIGLSIQEMPSYTYKLEYSDIKTDTISSFVIDEYGNHYRLGLFLTEYGYALLNTPALHIDFCDTVENMKSRLNYTNDQIVTYYSLGRGKKFENKKLSICKKCLEKVRSKLSVSIIGKEFYDFILSIEEDENLKCKNANSDGYTINWQQISKAYRESKKYTCENCGFKLKDFKYTKFLQTHHIKGNEKLNNKRNNLKCLCVKCHSEVDEYHKKQFSTSENILLMEQFEAHRKRS